MTTENAHVFLGDLIQDRNELRFLGRLRDDLARSGTPAIVFGNFIARARHDPRQIDFLVMTPQRLVHVELKTVDQSRPIVARANGNWGQVLPGGSMNWWQGNAYRQALDGTYAISDDLAKIIRSGDLPNGGYKPAKDIDTVVCLFPDIPARSDLQPFARVRVVGYRELLKRLQTPGPRPSWTTDHADAFARRLNLFSEPTDIKVARRQASDRSTLNDYRARFLDSRRRDLHEIVPVAVRDETGTAITSPVAVLIEAVENLQITNLTGASGTGKTHAAEHTAVLAARRGHVPIWVRCEDLQQDSFAVAMAKATAPFTTEPWSALLRRAGQQGHATAIILDGLNRCSFDQQRALLEGITSYRLATPCAVVITSHQPAPVSGGTLTTQQPDADESAAILASYGAPGLPNSGAFKTPMELALAASCASDITPTATPSDVLDLYVRRCTATEQERDVLRGLAFAMHRDLTFSTTVQEARMFVGDLVGVTPTAEQFDGVLASRLLQIGPQRLSFRHEVFNQFLAAQHLALQIRPGDDLASALRTAPLSDLRDMTVRLTTDGASRARTLIALEDPRLLAAAARGGLGPRTAPLVTTAIRETLESSRATTTSAQFVYTDEPQRQSLFAGSWRLDKPIAAADHALLTAAGIGLHYGVLVEEAVDLLDATDHRSDMVIRQMAREGVSAPISAVAAVTYTPMLTSTYRDDLPGTIVLKAVQNERRTRWADQYREARATQVRFARPGPARWGRLIAAMLSMNSDNDTDLELVPELVKEAWDARGHHVRCAALDLAHQTVRRMDDATKDRLRAVVENFDVRDQIMLSSMVVEILAECDAFDPICDATDIAAEIHQLLATPTNREARQRARGIIGAQYDDPRVVGPYAEVIGDLAPADLVALCAMGIRGDEENICVARDWAMTQIADHVEIAGADARRVVEELTAAPPNDSIMMSEGTQVHLEALRAWARIADQLPPATPSADLATRTWRLFDELVFELLRDQPLPTGRDTDEVWAELIDLCAPTAVDALHHIRTADWTTRDAASSIYGRLRAQYPAEIRTLLHWGLTHSEQVRPAVGTHLLHSQEDLIRELGDVGDDQTRELLREYLEDPKLAGSAVNAIRAIERKIR